MSVRSKHLQVLRGEPYSTPCDVFSFGIVMWEVLSERMPYTNELGVMMDESQYKSNPMEWYYRKVVLQHRRPDPLRVDKLLNDVMDLAWAEEADKRPTATRLRVMFTEMVEKYGKNLNT
jgi:serine/threonine protein kinase